MSEEARYRCTKCQRYISEGEYENDVCAACGEDVKLTVEYRTVYRDDEP